MEFNEKLQELRKQKGLTQEELAEALYVSRTAISKWESGRGYPNIESLKAIAKYFSVSVDQLLSSDAILNLAEEDQKRRTMSFRDTVFGLLDLSGIMLIFLPFFAQRAEGGAQEVSLLSLTLVQPYMKVAYFAVILAMALYGILTLALQNYKSGFWIKSKTNISLIISAISVLLFILSLNPYAAVFAFVLLAIKALVLIKK